MIDGANISAMFVNFYQTTLYSPEKSHLKKGSFNLLSPLL
jgi:hypothetical protein